MEDNRENTRQEEDTEDNCFFDRDDERYFSCRYPDCHCLSCSFHEEYNR